MPSDWRDLVRFTSIVWVVWLLLTLGILGYFASRDIQIVQQLRHGLGAEPRPAKHPLPFGPTTLSHSINFRSQAGGSSP